MSEDKEMEGLGKLIQSLAGFLGPKPETETEVEATVKSTCETVRAAAEESSFVEKLLDIVSAGVADDKEASTLLTALTGKSPEESKKATSGVAEAEAVTKIRKATTRARTTPSKPDFSDMSHIEVLSKLVELVTKPSEIPVESEEVSPHVISALEHAKKARIEFEKLSNPENMSLVEKIDKCIAEVENKVEAGNTDTLELMATFQELSGAMLDYARRKKGSRSDTLKSLGVTRRRKKKPAKKSSDKAAQKLCGTGLEFLLEQLNQAGHEASKRHYRDLYQKVEAEDKAKADTEAQKKNWESMRGLFDKIADAAEDHNPPEKIEAFRVILGAIDKIHDIDAQATEPEFDGTELTKADARGWICNARLIEHYRGLIREYRDYHRDMSVIKPLSGCQWGQMERQIERWQGDLNRLVNDQQCTLDEYPKLEWLPKIDGPGKVPYTKKTKLQLDLSNLSGIGEMVKSMLSDVGVEISM